MRGSLLIASVVTAGLLLPPLVYAALVYWKFGMLKVTWYIPYEEMLGALRGGKPAEIFAAPLFAANMTSGLVTANMFSLRIGELLLSIALGTAVGINFLAHARARALCVAAGSGAAATLAASNAGILGCCGPAFTGGILALAGLSATTAQAIALVSPTAQGALIAVLAVNYARLRRREAAAR
jgi:hypothetical protein